MSDLVDDNVLQNFWVSTVVISGFSGLLCLIILLWASIIYCVPKARRSLDRISFRLMLWSAGLEFINAVVWMAANADPSIWDSVVGTPVCVLIPYLGIGTTTAINWLNSCIAVNLMLAVCFLVDPTAYYLEWVYTIFSIFAGFGIPLVPAILGHFGWDQVYHVCYFAASDEETRTRHFLVDYFLWDIISCIVSLVSVTMVLLKIFRSGRATSRALILKGMPGKGSWLKMDPTDPNAPLVPVIPISRWSTFVDWCGRKTNMTLSNNNSRRDALGLLQDKFLDIALRVAIYPLVLIIVNIFSIASDLYFSSRAEITHAEFGLLILGNALPSARGIFFGILVIWMDPCLQRGYHAIRRSKHTSDEETAEELLASEIKDQSFIEFLYQGEVEGGKTFPSLRLHKPSTAGVEIRAALAESPLRGQFLISAKDGLSTTNPQTRESKRLSRCFPGVETTSLPNSFSDCVDMEIHISADDTEEKEVVLEKLEALPVALPVLEQIPPAAASRLGVSTDESRTAESERRHQERRQHQAQRQLQKVETLL